MLVLKLADYLEQPSLLFFLVVDHPSQSLAFLLELSDPIFLLIIRLPFIFFDQLGVLLLSCLILDQDRVDLLQGFGVLLFEGDVLPLEVGVLLLQFFDA